MGKDAKKAIRKAFRDTCFARDKYSCVMCSFKSTSEKAEKELDCHHVTNREAMPAGGYVKENGISLCAPCHIKAEIFYSTGVAEPGFAPNELYIKIGSTYEKAVAASKRLEQK